MENSVLSEKIGYAMDDASEQKLLGYCTHVVRAVTAEQNLSTFLKFVADYQHDDIYIVDIQKLNLQLVQLLPVLELMEENNNYFHVLEKGYLSYLNDEDFHHFFLKLAQTEKQTIVQRTQRGLEEAVKNGTRIGRPQIDPEIVLRIKFLHQSKKYTIREVAAVCGVSLGTAYKYAYNKKEAQETLI